MGVLRKVRKWLDGSPPARSPNSSTSLKPKAVVLEASTLPWPPIPAPSIPPKIRTPPLFSRPADDRALATHGVIALVADGMGGCRGGEIASALACESIPKSYFASDGSGSRGPCGQALEAAVSRFTRRRKPSRNCAAWELPR